MGGGAGEGRSPENSVAMVTITASEQGKGGGMVRSSARDQGPRGENA